MRDAADRARAAVAAAPREESAAKRLSEAVRLYRDSCPSPESEEEAPAPDVIEARRLIKEKDLEAAELLMRKHLDTVPNDPPAMHMMAEIVHLADFGRIPIESSIIPPAFTAMTRMRSSILPRHSPHRGPPRHPRADLQSGSSL